MEHEKYRYGKYLFIECTQSRLAYILVKLRQNGTRVVKCFFSCHNSGYVIIAENNHDIA